MENRDELCYKALSYWKIDNLAALSLYERALQLPCLMNSPWVDAQIYSNMGMVYSALENYHTAHQYLTTAYNLGLSNDAIVKEINWIENHFREVQGINNELAETYTFISSNHKRIVHNNVISHDYVQRNINLIFTNNKKRLELSVIPTLSLKGATLMAFNATSTVDRYKGDDLDYTFYIIYNDNKEIRTIAVQRIDTGVVIEYNR